MECIGRYITLNPSVILREIEILHANLSRNWNQYLTAVLTGEFEKESNRCSLEQTTCDWSARDTNAIEHDHP